MQTFYGEELKARLTVPKLEDSPVATFPTVHAIQAHS